MSLDVSGKLIAKTTQQTGEGRNGTWVKQEFIMELDGSSQYPRKLCLTAWGDRIREFDNLNIGDTFQASIDIESREYNGRWYTDVKPWRVTPSASNAQASPAAPGAPAAGFTPPPAAQSPTISTIPNEPDELSDLPF